VVADAPGLPSARLMDDRMNRSDARAPLLIVGLGNPGREHRLERHNVGFMVVDRLAAALDGRLTRRRARAQIAELRLSGRTAILAKPQTYMNLVGPSVARLATYHRIEPARLLVICDDLDLPTGTLRLRPFGGSAGHKGLRSIFDHLGTQQFPRLRIGIGRPPGRMDPADFVLQPFSALEWEAMDAALERAVQAIDVFAGEGIDAAMTRFNGAPR
jgi:PTH1 family peptidyl-tRNA hydrolase